jgi:hypothetical protein
MTRITTILIAVVFVGATGASGCGRSRARAPALRDLPAAFVPIDWGSSGAASAGMGGGREGCAVRLRDERDGTTLLLRRSQNSRETSQQGDATVTHYRAIGDYEVLTPGRYGLPADQWLRVDCGTWRAIGPAARS